MPRPAPHQAFSGLAPLLVALAVWYCLRRRAAEDPAERALRRAASALRERLGIRREDGFVLLGVDRPLPAAATAGVLCRGHVEAAARLALHLDFDSRQLDAFCVNLAGRCEAGVDKAVWGSGLASWSRNRNSIFSN